MSGPSYCTLFDESERELILEAVKEKQRHHWNQYERLSSRSNGATSEAAADHHHKSRILDDLIKILIEESI